MGMKESASQLELFSTAAATSEIRAQLPSTLRGFIRGYEKTLILAIAFIVISIISFSLGVEKGKNLVSLKKTNSQFDTAEEKQVQPKEEKNILENYTVQLASYKGKVSVQREADRLKKKGFSPLVLNKGQYLVLCVGNFSDKQKAETVLSEFRKRYPDCRIRRL
ncbi:MAG: SPOR domain-containing protein [Candidatus Omnitrophica bacterium]|nr:SPOR domain-containing protein [Candidatus Omnitrophota bacterium]